MEETMAARYWCHMCSQMVNPTMESEIKCPFCQSGFVEEMSGNGGLRDVQDPETEFGTTDRAMSLWAPILLGMMSSPRRRRRFRRAELGSEEEDNNEDDDVVDRHHHHHRARRHGGEIDLDREFESILRRRRRSSGNILQLLQGIRAGIASEYESSDNNERVIMINPYSQSLVVRGSSDQTQTQTHSALTSLGDYFIGPGLDLLLQHLAENDPNRQGTPPARKEAVEALPTVKITEPSLQCSVCLDDFERGVDEAKEMPCKHKFHVKCIVPWLELHNSCPVCRFELPSGNDDGDGESKVESGGGARTRSVPESSDREVVENVGERGREDEARSGNGRRFSIPWPFSGFFSSSSSSSSSSSASGSSQSGESNVYSRSYGSSR
ncbi:E3 ubiquitin-protein ligase SIRP1-like [Raphanus sativus]|uniref:RING-type E3 ubiquitin transferase n=1 Tax=Raphanus sativus TaxID=3726 RepID=A0A9W3CLD4_RAPSA|nr:E3 ubiquitin-protein ligase SIRP1-like [Raphanus sativus]